MSTTGEIMKKYPETFLVSSAELTDNQTFQTMYTELKKTGMCQVWMIQISRCPTKDY